MDESGTIPVSSLPKDERCERLRTSFAAHYGRQPDFYVRVPGRVNLIGEHIDYCGYGVCPMALDQDIKLAVAEDNEPTLSLMNLEEGFANYSHPISEIKIELSKGAPQWYQYFLCGVRGILDILPKDTQLKGFQVMVSGTVPRSAGLSSSSALVSAAALATARTHNFDLTKEKIASVCAECERYIGTQGGGMDQAIAFLATKGCAKMINFNPLRSEDVLLPPGAVFVIAHSLTGLNKAATADYNCRVIECRLAAQILAKRSGLNWKTTRVLGDLQKGLNYDLETMISLVARVLHTEPYSKEEVLTELEVSNETLDSVSLTENTKHIQTYKLHQRAMHVFEEALRVRKFYEECRRASGSAEGSLLALGRLMSESHASLRDNYECSHPQMDRLVELSEGLTFGARLTGAGWGGCIVALLARSAVDNYVRTIKETFYKPLGVEGSKLDSLIFATEPNQGACIYQSTN